MKLKVFGAGNEKDYTFVIFAKDKDFFHSFSELTKKAFGHSCYSHEVEKEAAAGKMKPKSIADYVDRHEVCLDEGHGLRFDMFFGSKRVFVMIHGTKKAKESFMNTLKRSAKFMK